MTIRHATQADIPAAVLLAQAFHAETTWRAEVFDPAKVTTLFEALTEAEVGCLLVVEHQGALVGFAAGAIGDNYFGPGQFAFEYGVYLDPAHRGGISGPRLVQAFLDWADGLGVAHKHMAISTGITADRTGALYQRLGGREAGKLYTWGF